MKTEFVNKIANDGKYQLQYIKSLFTHKKNDKRILIHFFTIIICLIAFHVYYFSKF